MKITRELSTGVADTQTGPVVDPEVHAITERGIEVADAIAKAEEFSHARAEFMLRNVAGMFNGGNHIDAKTLVQLSKTQQQRLKDLSVASYEMLGEKGQISARAELEMARPAHDVEAGLVLMRHSFNALQVVVSNGPGLEEGGYDPSQEMHLRDLVQDYASTFAAVYTELDTMGHPLATDPNRRNYFAGNVRAADPQPQEVVETNGDEEMWI